MNKDPNQNNESFISGIFNYCDSWCERCAFTSKCLTFAMKKEMQIKEDGEDIDITAFWNVLENLLDTTIDFLHEKSEEFGVDLDDGEEPDEDFEEYIEERKIERLINSSTDCAISSQEYIDFVDEWFNNLNHKTEELGKINDEALKEKFPLKIFDSIDVIRWYQYQIYVKIMRALSGKNEDEFDDFPKDSDGSAKVALIGIDRSISAWGNLLMNISDDDNSIFKILLHLVALQHAVEAKFPDARYFVRPGFDE